MRFSSTGVTVLIEFEPLFDLETSNDSLTFYDGPDTSYPLLYRAVGQTLPPSIRSTASVITVVFRSDAGVNGAGFSFKYTIGIAIWGRKTTWSEYIPVVAHRRSGIKRSQPQRANRCVFLLFKTMQKTIEKQSGINGC